MSRRRRSAASSGSIFWSSSSWRSLGSSASRSAASSGSIASSTSAARPTSRPGEDLDLVVLGQLLDDVGEPLVVQRRGDLGAAARAEVVDDLGEVGGLEVLVGLEQADRALAVGGLAQADDVLDRHEQGLAAAAPEPAQSAAARAGAHEGPRHGPAAGAELLDADVLDGRVDDHALVGAHLDRALEELGDDQGLVAALLEAAHVDQAGGDDLTALDRGDPGHRHEDPAPPRHLDDQADDARPRVGSG